MRFADTQLLQRFALLQYDLARATTDDVKVDLARKDVPKSAGFKKLRAWFLAAPEGPERDKLRAWLRREIAGLERRVAGGAQIEQHGPAAAERRKSLAAQLAASTPIPIRTVPAVTEVLRNDGRGDRVERRYHSTRAPMSPHQLANQRRRSR